MKRNELNYWDSRNECVRSIFLNDDEYTYVYKHSGSLALSLARKEFIYVNNVIVMNDPLYVMDTEAEEKYKLTKYAEEHIMECCLWFCKWEGKADLITFTPKPSGFNGEGKKNKGTIIRASTQRNRKYEDTITEVPSNRSLIHAAKELKQQGKVISEIYNELPNSFSKTLDTHIVRLSKQGRRITNLEIATETGLSEEYVRRLRKSDDLNVSLGVVCALCVVLHLEPWLSSDLIRKSGNDFPKTENGYLQQRLLYQYYERSLYEINSTLQEYGVKTWGKV